jgi:hypothetical protein
MCRSTRSLSLFNDQIAHCALGSDTTSSSRAFRNSGCAHKTFGDQAIERARPIKRHKARNSLAMIRNGHLASLANCVKVTAEVITKFAYSGFHRPSMALSSSNI